MAKPFQGTPNQTKKALVDSGAMDPRDFEPDVPASITSEGIKRDKTKMIPQAEYDATLAKGKAKKDANYLAELTKRHKK